MIHFMPIYYRSDTREPSEIFREGFKPRVDLLKTGSSSVGLVVAKANRIAKREDFSLFGGYTYSLDLFDNHNAWIKYDELYVRSIEPDDLFYFNRKNSDWNTSVLSDNRAEAKKQLQQFDSLIRDKLKFEQYDDISLADKPLGFKELSTITSLTEHPTYSVDDWWKCAIKMEGASQRLKEWKSAGDTNREVGISITSKLESAGIFPIAAKDKDESYLYVLALPEATKIQAVYDEDLSDIQYYLARNPLLPSDLSRIVIDLHSLQTQEAGMIVSQNPLQEYVGINAGWCLCAYESVAQYIPPENIVGAIKICTDKKERTNIPRVNSWLGNSKPIVQIVDYTGSFHFSEAFIENPHFKKTEIIKVCSGEELHCDYTAECTAIIEEIAQIKENRTSMNLPGVYYGLGGKTF